MANPPIMSHRDSRVLDTVIYPIQLAFAWVLFRLIGMEDAAEAPKPADPRVTGDPAALPESPVPHC